MRQIPYLNLDVKIQIKIIRALGSLFCVSNVNFCVVFYDFNLFVSRIAQIRCAQTISFQIVIKIDMFLHLTCECAVWLAHIMQKNAVLKSAFLHWFTKYLRNCESVSISILLVPFQYPTCLFIMSLE